VRCKIVFYIQARIIKRAQRRECAECALGKLIRSTHRNCFGHGQGNFGINVKRAQRMFISLELNGPTPTCFAQNDAFAPFMPAMSFCMEPLHKQT